MVIVPLPDPPMFQVTSLRKGRPGSIGHQLGTGHVSIHSPREGQPYDRS